VYINGSQYGILDEAKEYVRRWFMSPPEVPEKDKK